MAMLGSHSTLLDMMFGVQICVSCVSLVSWGVLSVHPSMCWPGRFLVCVVLDLLQVVWCLLSQNRHRREVFEDIRDAEGKGHFYSHLVCVGVLTQFSYLYLARFVFAKGNSRTSEICFCDAPRLQCEVRLVGNAIATAIVAGAHLAYAVRRNLVEPSVPQDPCGAPSRVLESMPVFTIHANTFEDQRSSDKNSNLCVICLSAFQCGDSVRRLCCWHVFHRDCADEWLAKSATCPFRCTLPLHARVMG